MSPEQANEHLRTIAKFRISKSQYFLGAIALALLLSLGISSLYESRGAGERSKILSNVETPAASIIFTQRETLVYATRLALWSNGGSTRRNVQIARNLLAQRLAVVDSSGRTMGSRANNGYWSALKRSDAIVAASPMGALPEQLHQSTSAQILPVIDEIVAQARNLVVSYQRSIDAEMEKLAADTARRDSLNLLLFYLFILTSGIALLLNVRGNFKSYRLAQIAIENEQRRLEETIEKLALAQQQVLQLQNLDQAKNALISNVNHELRTPLTSIMGYIELIQREVASGNHSATSKYLEVVERNSNILLNLVESILSLSKFDSGEGRLPAVLVSLNEVVDNAIFALKPALDAADISISYLPQSVIEVQGDKGQLSQVIINLLANAIKFSPSGSEIEIALAKIEINGQESARFEIRDHGIGIPEDDLPYLFTRFFRASNVKTSQHQGTGLGLAIVEQVINHHSGNIEVTSELGHGSTFTILIPIKQNGQTSEK